MSLKEPVKSLFRPAGKIRFTLERKKYGDATILSAGQGNALLARTLREKEPSAIGKIGATELGAVRHYLARKDATDVVQNWGHHQTTLYRNAGVFPADPRIHSRFAEEYLDAVRNTEILCIWFRWGERVVTRTYAPAASYVPIHSLEPYYHDNPWSAELAGKKVLVVTPFADSVREQYARRREVWARKPDVMPDFELDTLRTPLSAALVPPTDLNWFVTLDRLRDEMAERRWDAAIIGAGAWSLPLAAHARKLGRWGLHLGGPTQILFGIKGGRWDTNDRIASYYTQAWTRPGDKDRPANYTTIEGGCYW